jgi:site-specific DNA recombinase
MSTEKKHPQTHPATKRAIALVRVSQRDKDALSPEVQRRAIVKLAAEHDDWTLRPADILDENVDDNGKVRNVSASWELKDRPKLRHAVEEVEAKRARVIVAERFDRMFRNELLRRMVVKRIEDAGGELWSATAGEMTKQSAEGRLAHNVNGDVSEYTRDTAIERSWDAVEVAIEEGRYTGPVAPLGYRHGDGGRLQPDPKTRRTIVAAFSLRADGKTVREVRDYLAKRGIKRTASGVRQMLSSKVYVGEIHAGRHTPNLKAHEPIIDRDVFNRVQKMVVLAGRNAKSERLLARQGLLRCESCGGRMSASSRGSVGYPFYRCANDECGAKLTISADVAERAVIEAVEEAGSARKGHAHAKQRANRAKLQAKAADEAYRKAQRILADSGDEAEAIAILAEKRAARDAARERAKTLADSVAPAVTVDVAKIFRDGTLDEKRAVLRSRVGRVTVAPAAPGRRGAARLTIELLGE